MRQLQLCIGATFTTEIQQIDIDRARDIALMVAFSSEVALNFLQRFKKHVSRFLEPDLNNRVVKILRARFAIERRGFVNRRLHRWLRDAIECPNSIARTLKIREPIPQIRSKCNRRSHAEIPCRDRSAACKSKKQPTRLPVQ